MTMTTAETTAPLARMWTNWIDPRHVSPDALDAVRQRLGDESYPVVQLEEFWDPEKFRALSACIRQWPQWERLLVVRDDDSSVHRASEQEFAYVAPTHRFSSHDRAVEMDRELGDTRSISAEHQRWLRQFFAFAILTPALSSWLGQVFGRQDVAAASVEFARYRQGDYIAEHTDAVDQRLCHLVTYFDEDYAPDHGGTLLVIGRDGREIVLTPRFNSTVLLPLAVANRHRVEPWIAQRPGRWSASIAFRVGARP